MNRRDVIAAAGFAAVVAASGRALAEDQPAAAKPEGAPHEHEQHEHHDHTVAHCALIAAAYDCIKTGNLCLAHCLESFTKGDTELAGCAKSVDQMLATCAALAKLAATGSPHTAAAAKLALAICKDCEKECRKHADKHPTCKACAESCKACAAECEKLG